MKIIKLQQSHIKEAIDLVWIVFQEFGSIDYSTEGIKKFKESIDYDSIITICNRGSLTFWGYYDNNELVGIIAMKHINQICMLFVKKEYQRKHIETSLFEIALKNCKDNHFKVITVKSPPYLIEVYHRLGFKEIGTEQVIDGIPFTPMIYKLKLNHWFHKYTVL
ncbi:GNAT family N-acetyltransferase [Clostridium frigidicarnis]|uniref:Acetyltransferase (GNAT) domain-containing protein n=1 Tax=Clostridium frigidicarnis TaxID=84698 RepID=A0A1I0W058_9CLOT|nr:GNAT family N-acetyltransferase [Clostridium frigidicarnis]SFA81697.1 Acetyltransferase (GNAT) domain-containing protein [Clostridium frigidicarnis]